MDKCRTVDKNYNSSALDRLIKRVRSFFVIGAVLLACLFAMFKRFGELRTILTAVLSDKTIEIVRFIMQAILGTNSVYMALQMLISYAFVILGTVSVALLALGAFKTLLFAFKSFLFRFSEIRSKEIFFTKRSRYCVYLFYSKLNI